MWRSNCISVGGEKWHRDVASLWNLYLRARLGDGSSAPSLGGPTLDGSPMPFGSTATHEPIGIPRSLWARWNSLGATMKLYRMIGMTPREKRLSFHIYLAKT
ncbi:MAG: hypothetical protein QXQ57_08015 [Sulfolobales archaeon]